MTTNTNTNPWWAVYWSRPQAGRGAVASNGHQVVQAGDAAAANAAVLAGQPAGTVITNTLGPYTTQAAAQAFVSNPSTSVTGATTSGAADNIPNPLSGLAAIGAFFAKLGDANTWIRVAKVITGGTLLIVGLVHITGATNAVATAARKVPLPV